MMTSVYFVYEFTIGLSDPKKMVKNIDDNIEKVYQILDKALIVTCTIQKKKLVISNLYNQSITFNETGHCFLTIHIRIRKPFVNSKRHCNRSPSTLFTWSDLLVTIFWSRNLKFHFKICRRDFITLQQYDKKLLILSERFITIKRSFKRRFFE